MPYHDKRALALWFKVMKSWKPDAIDILGDIDDQLEYSTFSDGTTDEFFNLVKKSNPEAISPLPYVKEHAAAAREFYGQVRAQHKNADVHVSLGNHDCRIFKYMDKKAPDWISEVTPENLWGLDSLGFDYIYYADRPKMRFSDIYVHHGNTTSTTGLAVKKNVDDYGVSLVRGHSHNAGSYYKTFPMTNVQLQGWEMGHLCDPTAYGLRYTNNPAWELGFGIAHVVDDVPFIQFIPISNEYVAVVDGKVYRG